ncbi:MAG: hypothetical protein HYV09_26165 [Deltaproteobacteria bacterium]|nr:hypothetical protein [Deltaproteobacteria bacterium]
MGAGEWMVVDSCLDASTHQPVALTYLADLGIDVATAVKLVVVTHWHDDHMRGAARVLHACAGARFVCSGALANAQFLGLVASEEIVQQKDDHGAGVSEFAEIVEELRRRGGRSPSSGPEWARADQDVFYRPAASSLPEAHVRSLSPSAATMTVGFKSLQQPRVGTTRKALVSPEPNDTAVVLRVRVGEVSALLGADLETGNDPGRGWLGVIGAGIGPVVKSELYKVAHHGSKSADHEAIWSTLLDASPLAVLTPFVNGSVQLPRDSDVDRITRVARRLLATSTPRPIAPPPRDAAVERTMREVTKSRRVRTGRMGHIRVRHDGRHWREELFGAAFDMSAAR